MGSMERPEIVHFFLKHGYQLDGASLEFFTQNQGKINEVLEKITATTQKTITLALITNLLTPPTPPAAEIIITKTPSQQSSKKSVDNIGSIFRNRYEIISKIIADKPDMVNLISINKITPKSKDFSIIGMVKEKDIMEKSLILEDQSGEVAAYADGVSIEDIVLDEIMGVVCEQNEFVKIKKIIWPDVPLAREVKKAPADLLCAFISDSLASNEKFYDWLKTQTSSSMYFFVFGDATNSERIASTLPNSKIFSTKKDSVPVWVKINDINILLLTGGILENYKTIWRDQTSTEILAKLLKKRHINPVFEFNKKLVDDNLFILDEIPDILVCSSAAEPDVANYKGTTIISAGSFINQHIFFIINLRTRETIKIDLT
jgi:DNA polymerase II small subunit/DNA polymerase delta subunit B